MRLFTEDQANGKFCPMTFVDEPLKCCGSGCMWWEWEEWISDAGRVYRQKSEAEKVKVYRGRCGKLSK